MCETVKPERAPRIGVLAIMLLWAAIALGASGASAAVPPQQDPFYKYTGSTALTQIAPGTVLKTRSLHYHVAGIPAGDRAVQLLYRSTGQIGQPTVNVTSVLEPPRRFGLGCSLLPVPV